MDKEMKYEDFEYRFHEPLIPILVSEKEHKEYLKRKAERLKKREQFLRENGHE